MEKKSFAKVPEMMELPSLSKMQVKAYEDFLQPDVVPPTKRKNVGLEAILREVFPIESYDKKLSIEYKYYELGQPRYMPEECKMLRLTYGRPLRIHLVLHAEQPIEEDVYLGEVPIMLGGGEYIINGAERVIVSQLHRSPGVDFLEEVQAGDRRAYSCRIIPERGSWIEINVTKKDSLSVRVDQSAKLPVTCLLRAASKEFSTDLDIVRTFYSTKVVKLAGSRAASLLVGAPVAADVVDPVAGEVILQTGEKITEPVLAVFQQAEGLKQIEIITELDDPLVINTLREDTSKSHEDALLKIYKRLRPGNPENLDKAEQLFREKFYDDNRYRLGRVGRFRMNRKFGEDVPVNMQVLRPQDLVNAIKYLLELRAGRGQLDDIDHLGNRRIRTLDELATDEIRKGFLKLRRTVQERMSLSDTADLTPRALINSKTVSSAIEYFFGRGELSQVVDQTNPLAQLQHERRLSALGPGGLNRKRAGFEVRDVHISHYGRICPIETPEGTNIGLISNLSVYSDLDEYGFMTTPYRVVKNGVLKDDIVNLRADEETDKYIAPATTPFDEKGSISEEEVLVRHNGDFTRVPREKVDYIDISPKQMVGISASLIPFLEHDDANRALMGSNMQRQAVPLIRTERPIVSTGMESVVAANSSMVVRAERPGVVTAVDSQNITVGGRDYPLRKFVGLSEGTCLNQKPIVKLGDRVKSGQIIADGAATCDGELALGRNVLVAFMPWDGYNFEDAILINEKLVKQDAYTSVHIEEFEVEIRETKLGREEFTRDIPNVSEKALRDLGDDGVIRVGTRVSPGDILVGKIAPKSKSELSPEEKLLHAIVGKAGEDVKNDSLVVPGGVEGVVVATRKFARRSHLTDKEQRELDDQIRKLERDYRKEKAAAFVALLEDLMEIAGVKTIRQRRRGGIKYDLETNWSTLDNTRLIDEFDPAETSIRPQHYRKVEKRFAVFRQELERLETWLDRRIQHMKRGDDLPSGVLELVKVWIATKRQLSVGDKMAGRHGNKGVIAKILPEEDMPFLEDGTAVDIILNPLGVPGRLNVGQILETHLGWAAKILGFQAVTPGFDGATEDEIRSCLREAKLPPNGKVTLYDGRTGESFDQDVTVGYIYMMKLRHLVDDKIHARATGPYSLITQQPLGGKARSGGQRFGEMEIWALEAYGAAYTLQEMLTVKSDDVEGRTKIYEAMVKGENTLEAGTPVSFEVLTNEIRGLGLNVQLEKKKI